MDGSTLQYNQGKGERKKKQHVVVRRLLYGQNKLFIAPGSLKRNQHFIHPVTQNNYTQQKQRGHLATIVTLATTLYFNQLKNTPLYRLRPYYVECTGSRSITEVNLRRAWLVLGWVTAWEYHVLQAFHFVGPCLFFYWPENLQIPRFIFFTYLRGPAMFDLFFSMAIGRRVSCNNSIL